MRSENAPTKRPGRPTFSFESAQRALRVNWGIAGTLSELPSHSDQNLRVHVDDGPGFVLRVANAGQNFPFLNTVVELLAKLSNQGLGTQKVVASLDGASVVELADARGHTHLAGVTVWIEGRTLAAHPTRDAHTLRSLGRFIGRLDEAIADCDAPALHRELPWDLGRGAQEIGLHRAGLLADPLFEAAFADHMKRYEPLLQRLPTATVHNDPNDHNVLISSDPKSPEVVGILDFGDAIHSFRVADLAIGAAYAMLGNPTPVNAVRHVVEGYIPVRPLAEIERHLLLPLIRLRLMVSLVLSGRAAELEPDNAYLTTSRAGAWQALAHLSEVDFGQAETQIFERSPQ